MNLRWVPLLVECCLCLHNFCINEREKDWLVSDIPNEAIENHRVSYEEYLDELDNDGHQRAGGHINIRSKVREAIKKQLKFAGRDRPAYNKRRNFNSN